MAEMTFNTTPGQTVARELLVAFLNTGTKETPVWSPIGKRVEDSSIEMDWSIETSTDIMGDTYTRGKKATKTQTFDPWDLDGGDEAQKKIWNIAVKDNDVNALLAQDMLIAHLYAGDTGKNFAERYEACGVIPTRLGGEGGGSVSLAIEVTYGGARTTGTVAVAGGVATFTPEVGV